MKIDNKNALIAALSSVPSSPELAVLLLEATKRYGNVDDENFYLHRDFLRLNWSEASGVLLDAQNKWVPTPFGVEEHFAHFAVDGSGKVSYTKDEDKGDDDIQTRATVGKYYGNYDVAGSNPDVYVSGAGKANTGEANTGEAKLGRAVELPPEVVGAITRMRDAVDRVIIRELTEDDGDGASTRDVIRAVNTALDILKAVVTGK